MFSVDIHPNAEIGAGVFIDHAHGIVIGETAVVEDDVSMLHSVTLGGTGKTRGDRHPKIRRGVLIGAGAKILGNIEVGEEGAHRRRFGGAERRGRALHRRRRSGKADRRAVLRGVRRPKR